MRQTIVLLAVAAIALGFLIITVPLRRTQEARVQETAREILDGSGWLIPHCNGVVRLHKPPLMYWMVAGSFRIFGVSVWAGRLPIAVLSWLTVLLVFDFGRRMLGARAGFMAAATLTGTYLFQRYGPLAETDGPSMFFVTLAIYAMWRAAETPRRGTSFFWNQTSAAAVALAALSKGPPALFPVLFLPALGWTSGRRRIIRDWIFSGAPFTLALLGAPWWIFAALRPESQTIAKEVGNVLTGSDHGGPPWRPLAELAKATLPWVGLAILAVTVAIAHWRAQGPARILLAWAAVILLPLMIVPQKQEHYLMPLMPAIMLAVGWMIDRAISGDARQQRLLRWVLGGTLLVGLLIVPMPLLAGPAMRGLLWQDWATALAILAAIIPALAIFVGKPLAHAAFAASLSAVAVVAMALGLWGPSLENGSHAEVARGLRASYGNGPYAFYASESLPLVFELRQIAPVLRNPSELATAVARSPGLVVIGEDSKPGDAAPPGTVRTMEFYVGRRCFGVYRASRSLQPPL